MIRKTQTKHLLYTVTAAVFAALIAVMTSLFKFNTGINNGYLHFGDCMVYLAACVLPAPYAIAAGAIGGGMADVLAGVAVWAPFTAVIKALNTLPFSLVYTLRRTASPEKILSKATAPMPFVSGLITVFGYLLAEGLLYTFPTAWTSVPFSVVQAIVSAAVFYVAAAALDQIKFKSRIFKSI